ncbi:hypothetical protein ACNVED_10230 [Legionella sp. D16C41]|uniref:hypothetical protein n=1 Tax=Legionella sp. D16C41 TaxID=3402688 RepID=UPI003AF602A3
MKKQDKNPAHPEVEGLENICHVTPKSDSAKEVCDTIKKDKKNSEKTSNKKSS